MLYFDTHAHYDWKEFDKDREDLFKNFNKQLCGIVNVGINCESTEKVIEYSKKYDFLYYAIGIHPMEVSKNIPISYLDKILCNSIHSDKKLIAIRRNGFRLSF